MFLMSFALLLLLVVGGTMAWFTAESGEVVNTFKAGTVRIELHEKKLENIIMRTENILDHQKKN